MPKAPRPQDEKDALNAAAECRPLGDPERWDVALVFMKAAWVDVDNPHHKGAVLVMKKVVGAKDRKGNAVSERDKLKSECCNVKRYALVVHTHHGPPTHASTQRGEQSRRHPGKGPWRSQREEAVVRPACVRGRGREAGSTEGLSEGGAVRAPPAAHPPCAAAGCTGTSASVPLLCSCWLWGARLCGLSRL
jgi:hypothetical protein